MYVKLWKQFFRFNNAQSNVTIWMRLSHDVDVDELMNAMDELGNLHVNVHSNSFHVAHVSYAHEG